MTVHFHLITSSDPSMESINYADFNELVEHVEQELLDGYSVFVVRIEDGKFADWTMPAIEAASARYMKDAECDPDDLPDWITEYDADQYRAASNFNSDYADDVRATWEAGR